MRAYLDSSPYVIATKRDSETQRLIYFLQSVRSTPLRISALLGDTINNLRSALDHVAYQVVLKDSAAPPKQHVYFPIADTEATYLNTRSNKMKGASPRAIREIDALKPYAGGNDELWKLHKLNNIDKHRMLITAGSAFHSFNFGALLSSTIDTWFPEASPPKMDLYLQPADRMFPLHAGCDLFIDVPNADPNPELHFRFDLCFGESGVVTSDPILESVRRMSDQVETVIKCLTPLLV